MAVLSETFDSGADGTTLLTSNTTFDAINASGTREFDTGITLHGAATALLTSSAGTTPYLKWDAASWAGASTTYFRWYMRADDVTPTANTVIASIRETDSSTIGCQVRLTTTGAFEFRAPLTAQTPVSTYTMSNDTWVRCELQVVSSATVGSMSLRLFYGANLEGSTADETLTISSLNTGDGTVGGASFGIHTNPGNTMTLHLDEIIMSDVGWIGPVSGTAATELTNTFETGLADATAITTGNSAAGTAGDAWDAVTGAGTAVYDSDIAIHDTLTGLLGVTSGQNSYLVWNTGAWAGSTDAYIRFYFRVNDPTLASSAVILSVRESDGSTVGCDVRLNTTGKLECRAPATVRATSTLTVAADTWYRLELYVSSNASTGAMTLNIYTGSQLEGNNPTETLTVTGQDTGDGTVGGIAVGIVSDPGQTLTMSLDSIGISDSTWLGPVGTPASTFLSWIGMRTFPAPADTGGDTPSSILVPATGSIFGSTVPEYPGSGSDPTGLAEFVAFTNYRPGAIGFYYTNNWSGVFSSTELTMFDPGGGQAHAIPHIRWKVGSSSVRQGTWADVANGVYDTELVAAAAGVKTYPHRFFMSFFHEPDGDEDAGENTKEWYAEMWRHCRAVWDAEGVSNAVYVLNFQGYPGHADDTAGTGFSRMIAEEAVDWIGWDPYVRTISPRLWEDVVNNQIGAPGSFPGMYDFLTTNYPTKPLMLCEFGTGFDYPGGSTGGLTEAEAKANFDTWVDTGSSDGGMSDSAFSAIKAHMYWNARGTKEFAGQAGALQAAGIKSMTDLPMFDQDYDLFK